MARAHSCSSVAQHTSSPPPSQPPTRRLPHSASPSADHRRFALSTDDAAVYLDDTMDSNTVRSISDAPSALAILTPQRMPRHAALTTTAAMTPTRMTVTTAAPRRTRPVMTSATRAAALTTMMRDMTVDDDDGNNNNDSSNMYDLCGCHDDKDDVHTAMTGHEAADDDDDDVVAGRSTGAAHVAASPTSSPPPLRHSAVSPHIDVRLCFSASPLPRRDANAATDACAVDKDECRQSPPPQPPLLPATCEAMTSADGDGNRRGNGGDDDEHRCTHRRASRRCDHADKDTSPQLLMYDVATTTTTATTTAATTTAATPRTSHSPRRVRSPSVTAVAMVPLEDYLRVERERNQLAKMYEHQKSLYEAMAERHASAYASLQERIVDVVALSSRNEESKRFIRQLKREMAESKVRVMEVQNRAMQEAQRERSARYRYEALQAEQERQLARMHDAHDVRMSALTSLLRDVTALADGGDAAVQLSQLDALLRAAYGKNAALFRDLLQQSKQLNALHTRNEELQRELSRLHEAQATSQRTLAEERERMTCEAERLVEQVEEQQQSIMTLRQMLLHDMERSSTAASSSSSSTATVAAVATRKNATTATAAKVSACALTPARVRGTVATATTPYATSSSSTRQQEQQQRSSSSSSSSSNALRVALTRRVRARAAAAQQRGDETQTDKPTRATSNHVACSTHDADDKDGCNNNDDDDAVTVAAAGVDGNSCDTHNADDSDDNNSQTRDVCATSLLSCASQQAARTRLVHADAQSRRMPPAPLLALPTRHGSGGGSSGSAPVTALSLRSVNTAASTRGKVDSEGNKRSSSSSNGGDEDEHDSVGNDNDDVAWQRSVTSSAHAYVSVYAKTLRAAREARERVRAQLFSTTMDTDDDYNKHDSTESIADDDDDDDDDYSSNDKYTRRACVDVVAASAASSRYYAADIDAHALRRVEELLRLELQRREAKARSRLCEAMLSVLDDQLLYVAELRQLWLQHTSGQAAQRRALCADESRARAALHAAYEGVMAAAAQAMWHYDTSSSTRS